MDQHLGKSMVLHAVIRVFQSNHGRGTASIKEKNPAADWCDMKGGHLWYIFISPQGLQCNEPLVVPQDPGGLWRSTKDTATDLEVQVTTDHGRKSDRILRWPLWGVLWSHQGIPTTPKYIQFCCGCSHQELDDDHGGGGIGSRIIIPIRAVGILLIICGQWLDSVYPTGVAPVLVWYTYRGIWISEVEYKHDRNGRHDLPNLPRFGQALTCRI